MEYTGRQDRGYQPISRAFEASYSSRGGDLYRVGHEHAQGCGC